MTGYERTVFGQSVPEQQLSGMARNIVAGIGDGQPAPLAGFVWYRPEGLSRQHQLHQLEQLRRVA